PHVVFRRLGGPAILVLSGVKMNDGRSRSGRIDGLAGDLFRVDRQIGGHCGRVNRASNGTADNDLRGLLHVFASGENMGTVMPSSSLRKFTVTLIRMAMPASTGRRRQLLGIHKTSRQRKWGKR